MAANPTLKQTTPSTPGGNGAAKNAQDILAVVGHSGLKQYGGFVYEEFLRELQGDRWRAVIKEMSEQDPVVGAILFVVEMLLRQVPWNMQPGLEEGSTKATPEAEQQASFFDGCLHDMSASFGDTLAEIISFLPWGWDYHEVNYKVRRGPEQEEATLRSRFSDGLIGWRSFAIRSQDSLLRWEFDDAGGIQGMWQMAPPDFLPTLIPIDKALLFRTTVRKGNPEGRALDPETPIPTPDGWREMGALEVGDKLFDEQGRIRYVVGRQEWENRPCFDVLFNDGTSIIADAEHLWVTQTAKERYAGRLGRVRTTRELAASVKASTGTSNHSVTMAGRLDYPEQALPLDPWALGLWLGDGSSNGAMVACHADDAAETVELLEAVGITSRVTVNGTSTNGRSLRMYGRHHHDPAGPSAALRLLGLYQNKHIPEPYLRGSIAQREALLSGLMDSDGHVDRWGRCSFSNTNLNLSLGVLELVRSLGVPAVLRERPASPERGRPSRSWLVKFTPTSAPFRLARKANRCKLARGRMAHYIVAVAPVAPRATVCIETDAPSHLFLAGSGMVATHNSILRSAYRPWYFKKNIENIEGVGIERDLAGLPVAHVPPDLLAKDAPQAKRDILAAIEELVQNIRRDQQEGVVFPMEYDENNNPLYKLELLSSGGSRQFNTSEIITRYDLRIAMMCVADFIMIGQQQVGSFALVNSKTNTFTMALEAWLDMVAEVVNEHAIPKLMRLNGWDTSVRPKLGHGQIKDTDLVALSTFLLNLSNAGFPLLPNPDLVKFVLTEAGLPAPAEESS